MLFITYISIYYIYKSGTLALCLSAPLIGVILIFVFKPQIPLVLFFNAAL